MGHRQGAGGGRGSLVSHRSQQARGQGRCEVVVGEGQTPGTGRAWSSVKAGDISSVGTR